MNSLDRLTGYLAGVERRLRWLALSRGAAITAAAALVCTVAAVLVANRFAFAPPSVLLSRLALFLGIAFALALGLIAPLLRVNRRRAAREAEQRFPEFEERLLTLAERLKDDSADPFLALVASDSMRVAERAAPDRVAAGSRVAAFAGTAAFSLVVLVWLGTSGPGFLGYGTSLLWGGIPKEGAKPFYDVVVEPGDRTIRKRADQAITARLVGFRAERVRVLAKFASSSKWEQAEMRPQPDGPAWQFLFAGVPESLEYYVEAGGVRSKTYRLNVVELPNVKRIRVTYHYPAWTGMPSAVEDPGGDLRAVEGTRAEIAIQTDRSLNNGALLLDDGRKIPLRSEGGGYVASVPIEKDGLYYVASAGQGEDVRLTEDYFIEARKDDPPSVRIVRPGRDARVSPIEEVVIAVEGKDDFGLRDLMLHYSVNAGPEKTVPMLRDSSTTLYLEDYKLAPGDIVSFYATARDARATARTDIFFLEAQPFERQFTQSQQAAGGGGGGQQGDDGRISQRQKEIIAATWNQIKETDKSAAAENAAFLAGVQGKLRDQARSLVNRMRSRELAGANESFKGFVEDMEKAIEAMGPAAERLKGREWRKALEPEQKALQHLLRAEATFRNIQVAFGNRGGGGGGGGGGLGRDLEGLFDLELDTEKNQYETGQQSASSDQRQREIDEALQKLEQLARRQQELADQQRRNPQQVSEQRWQQEMLRREAEQLRRQIEQLARNSSASQSQQGQSGQQSRGGGGGGMQSEQLRRAIEQVEQATRQMSQAAGSQRAGTPQSEADARRAAERLKEARDALSSMRRQEAGREMDDLVGRAEKLAATQRDFGNRMRQAFGSQGQDPNSAMRRGADRRQSEQLAEEKQRMTDELRRLEEDMQRSARDMAGTQREAANRLRQALGNLQQEEVAARMRLSADFIRRGLGAYAVMREALTTQALDQLRDDLQEARNALREGQQGGQQAAGAQGSRELERALAETERLRRQLEQMRQAGSRQSGGQQSGGQQAGGQQAGGQQAGGQQSGGQGQRGGNEERDARGQQGGGARGGSYSAMNRGDWQPAPGGRPLDERAWQQSVRDLGRLQQLLAGEPEVARDVQSLLREMQNLDPNRFPGNPELLSRLHGQVLIEIEQMELRLRRMLDGQQGGNVRSRSAQPPPPEYADAVAEYFRRLSKEK